MSTNKTLEELLAQKITEPTLVGTKYTDTSEGIAKNTAIGTAKDNLTNWGEHQWENEQINKDLLSNYLNRDPFSYDVNGDAIYQQYKDKYIQQGKMAMADTMGQAAAMTGGYGNSYAATVGNQAYQASLQNLNDIVPELYQMAYDRYNQKGQDMVNQLAVLAEDYARSYGKWETGYNVRKDALDYATNDFFSNADLYNKNLEISNGVAQQDYLNKLAQWQESIDNAQWQKTHDLSERELKMAEEAWKLQKESLTPKPTGNTSYQAAKQNAKDKAEANKKKDSTTLTYDQIRADLGTLIKNGADKSEVNNYLRGALNAGYIDNAMYNKLKDLYAPRGYTY